MRWRRATRLAAADRDCGPTYILAVNDNRPPPPGPLPRQSPRAAAGDPARSQLPAAAAPHRRNRATPATAPRRPPPPPLAATALLPRAPRRPAPGRRGPAAARPYRPAEKAPAQAPWGRVAAGAPAVCVVAVVPRHLDGLVAEPYPRARRLPGTARAGRGTTWLLVGSDSRQGLTPEQQAELTTGGDLGAGRTDTILLVHLPGSGRAPRRRWCRSRVTPMSPIPGYGSDKINAAFSLGGPRCWRRPWSRRPVCGWTTTPRSVSTGSPCSSTRSAG